MKKNVIFAAAAAGCLAALSVAVWQFKPALKQSAALEIGALLCLTGDCAEWGSASLRGMQLAAEELNARGGVRGRPLRLVVQDSSENSPANAVAGFNYLRSRRGMQFIIGPSWTPAGLAIAPLAASDPQLLITSPSLGVAKFNETAGNIFNVWPHDVEATRTIARFALAQGYRRAAVFSSQQPYEKTQGDAFAEIFAQGGGTITKKVEPLPMGVDLKPEALSILRSDPDVVFFANFSSLAHAAKELRKLGYRGPQLTVLLDDTRIAAADGALEGTIFTAYPEPQKSFRSKYYSRFGEEPPITADTAYDAVHLYARAMENSDSFDPASVQRELSATRGYNGASGRIEFDPTGGVLKEALLRVVRSGSFADL